MYELQIIPNSSEPIPSQTTEAVVVVPEVTTSDYSALAQPQSAEQQQQQSDGDFSIYPAHLIFISFLFVLISFSLIYGLVFTGILAFLMVTAQRKRMEDEQRLINEIQRKKKKKNKNIASETDDSDYW